METMPPRPDERIHGPIHIVSAFLKCGSDFPAYEMLISTISPSYQSAMGTGGASAFVWGKWNFSGR
jgi:hypothetical protein